MQHKKKMIPPKHTQYQSFHWPGDWAAAFSTAMPWASMYGPTYDGTLDAAVSWAAYGLSACSCGATEITPSIGPLLFWMVVRMVRPLAPPPAAAMAWLTSLGGIVAGLEYVASLANSAGFASSTASSGASLCALASCTLYFSAAAMTFGWLCANAICCPYLASYVFTVVP